MSKKITLFGLIFFLFVMFSLGTVSGVFAQIPGGTLDPLAVPKYATPLLVPPVMPTAGRIVQKGGKNVDYYEISMKQITQQILPGQQLEL